MSFYAVMSALLVDVRACIGDVNCDYTMFVSMGEPPAELTSCNQLYAYFDGSELLDESDQCNKFYKNTIIFGITRCCSYDGQITWDAGREDGEAQCFLTDLQTLQECLVCNAPAIIEAQYRQMCNDTIQVAAVQLNPERQGDCYTAYVSLEFNSTICC